MARQSGQIADIIDMGFRVQILLNRGTLRSNDGER